MHIISMSVFESRIGHTDGIGQTQLEFQNICPLSRILIG